jgi:excisionase family DNA binding protein
MEELFTVKEVAEKLKISVSSVYRYAENGLFPHQKLGSNIRFTNEHITAFLSSKSGKPGYQNSLPQTIGGMRTLYDNWY